VLCFPPAVLLLGTARAEGGDMASGKYVDCPECGKRFFVGDEFFRLPEARCHCPYCSHQFAVNKQPA
jgi:DNA-directed RNA polymerase subunit RPC12/RpoP